MIAKLKEQFKEIVRISHNLETIIPKEIPEKRLISERLTEGMLWLDLLIKMEEQEKINPVKLKLKEVPNADYIPGE